MSSEEIKIKIDNLAIFQDEEANALVRKELKKWGTDIISEDQIDEIEKELFIKAKQIGWSTTELSRFEKIFTLIRYQKKVSEDII